MGETGCGKTYLLKTCAQLEKVKLEILNIHAGITEEDVIKFMNTVVIPFPNYKKLWVFFDEINTSNCIGLINEIMSNYTMRGEPLSKDITFIAACNPYRLRKKGIKDATYGLVYKREEKDKQIQKLVYNVLPLPHSLINFVFDFGNLSKEDEKKYISSMVALANIGDGLNELCQSLIETCQNYIRDNYDVSSVSLRDAKRFSIFYEGFVKSIKAQNTIDKKNNVNEKDIKIKASLLSIYICYILRLPEEDMQKNIYNEISKVFCNCKYNYTKEMIEELIISEVDRLTERIKLPKGIALNKALKENCFALISCIQNKVPLFICGKPGCSKTLSVNLVVDSLKGSESLDEYFKTLPSLILVGYQGSRTTTSDDIMKLFEKANEINKKENPFLYNNTNNDNEKNHEKSVPLIFFDELGLAEVSENNPLKVLHSLLEPDDRKNKIPFIGISNWELDASKQNRGIFISRPDLGDDDLIKTANVIAKSYEINPNPILFTNLAKAYNEFKKQIQKKKEIIQRDYDLFKPKKNTNKKYFNDLEKDLDKIKRIEDFHGTRDYYNLIKKVSQKIKEEINSQRTISEEQFLDKSIGFARAALERNFRGLDLEKEELKNMTSLFLSKFNKPEVKEYKILECINENIEDNDSRYLILISNGAVSAHLVKLLIEQYNAKHNNKKNVFVYIGSKFKKDKLKQEYTFRTLTEILLHINKGDFLIMKNLDSVYPSLFDLFNQNFKELGNKRKYAKVSVGMINRPEVYVNSEFRCAVLLDEDDALSQDPPFLNRFEKHSLSFDILMHHKTREYANGILTILKEMRTFSTKKEISSLIDISVQIINCEKEEIFALVYSNSVLQNIKDESLSINKSFSAEVANEEKLLVQKQVLKSISKTFSQDLILFSHFSKYNENENNRALYFEILKYYKANEKLNFGEFMKDCNSKKNIIFTFSDIDEKIMIYDKIYNSFLEKEVCNDSITELIISSYDEEKALQSDIQKFYAEVFSKDKNSVKSILILKFSVLDTIHLNLVSQIIENMDIGYNITKSKKMIIIFTIHIKRIFVSSEKDKENINYDLFKINQKNYISRLENAYDQRFIDNLNSKFTALSFVDLLRDITKISEIIPFETILEKLIIQSYETLKMKFLNDYNKKYEKNPKVYSDEIRTKLMENKICRTNLIEEIKNYLIKYNLFENFLKKNKVVENTVDIYNRFRDYCLEISREYLIKFFMLLEEKGGIKGFIYITNNDEASKIFEYINSENLAEMQFNDDKISNVVSIILDMQVPFSKLFFDKISDIISNKINEYKNNEYKRNKKVISKGEYDNQKKVTISSYIHDMKEYLLQKTYFSDISNSNFIIDDFLTYYFASNKISIKYTNNLKWFIKNKLIDSFENIDLKDRTYAAIFWIFAFDDFIKFYLNLYEEIIKINNNNDFDFISIYTKKESDFTNDDEGIEEKSSNKELYLLIETLLNFLIEMSNYLNNDQQIQNYIKKCNFFYNELKQYNEDYCLKSPTLEQIEIISYLLKKGISEKDIFKLFGVYRNILIQEETTNNDEELSNLIKKEFEFLENLKNDNIINQRLMNKFKNANKNIPLRKSILDIILSNIKYLKFSKNILDFAFCENGINNNDTINLTPHYDKNNQGLECLFEDGNHPIFLILPEDYNKLPDNNKRIFELFIMEIFENHIYKFLKTQLEDFSILHEVNIKEELIVFLGNAISEIEVINAELNNDFAFWKLLNLLYYISYIKVFLFLSSKIIGNQNLFQKIINTNTVLEKLDNTNIKSLQIYLVKCIKFHNSDNFGEFSKFDFGLYNIEWLKGDAQNTGHDFFNVTCNDFYSYIYMLYINDLNIYTQISTNLKEYIAKPSNNNALNNVKSKIKDNNNYFITFIKIFTEMFLSLWINVDQMTVNNNDNVQNNNYQDVLQNIKLKYKDYDLGNNENIHKLITFICNNRTNYSNFIKMKKSDLETNIIIFGVQFFILLSKYESANYFIQKNYLDFLSVENLNTALILMSIITLMFQLINNLINDDFKEDLFRSRLITINNIIIKLNAEVSKGGFSNPFIYISEVIISLSEKLNGPNINSIEGFTKIISEIDEKLMKNGKDISQKLLKNYYDFLKLPDDNLRALVNEYEDPIKYEGKYPLLKYFLLTNHKSLENEINKEIEIEIPESSISKCLKDKCIFDVTTFIQKINPFIDRIYKEASGKYTRNKLDVTKLSDLKVKDTPIRESIISIKNELKLIDSNIDETTVNGFLNNLNIKLTSLVETYNTLLSNIKKYESKKQKAGKDLFSKTVLIENAKINEVLPMINNHDNIINNNSEIINNNETQKIEDNFYDFFKENMNRQININNNNEFNLFYYKEELINFNKLEENFFDKYLLTKPKFDKKRKEFFYLFEIGNKIKAPNLLEEFRKKISNQGKIDSAIQNQIKSLIGGSNNVQSSFDPLVGLNYLQQVIYYANDNKDNIHKLKAKDIIKEIPDIFNEGNEDIIRIFNNNNISVNQLLNIYEFYEEFYVGNLLECISEEYKQPLSSNKAIIDHFKKNDKPFFSKADIINALRKFMLRNIIDCKKPEDINYDENIFEVIGRQKGIWDPDKVTNFKMNLFNNDITELKTIDIKVNQVVKLYEELIKSDNKTINKEKKNNPHQRKKGSVY